MTLKKDIKIYGNRKQININKNELVNDKFAFIYTSEEHDKVQQTIKSLNNEVDALKHDITTKDAIINEHENTINDFNIKFRSAIEDAKADARAEHEQTIQQQQSMIQQLQHDIQQQHILIKEYEDATAKHNKEVSTLTAKLSHITNLYNNIRSAIAKLSRLDVLFNKQRDILTQYPLIDYDAETDATDITIKHDKE